MRRILQEFADDGEVVVSLRRRLRWKQSGGQRHFSSLRKDTRSLIDRTCMEKVSSFLVKMMGDGQKGWCDVFDDFQTRIAKSNSSNVEMFMF